MPTMMAKRPPDQGDKISGDGNEISLDVDDANNYVDNAYIPKYLEDRNIGTANM